jgi:hypothetical protein
MKITVGAIFCFFILAFLYKLRSFPLNMLVVRAVSRLSALKGEGHQDLDEIEKIMESEFEVEENLPFSTIENDLEQRGKASTFGSPESIREIAFLTAFVYRVYYKNQNPFFIIKNPDRWKQQYLRVGGLVERQYLRVLNRQMQNFIRNYHK